MDKRRRRLSRLSLKKHFRRSRIHDCVERTFPNKSISIISISSTDDESAKSDDSIDSFSSINQKTDVNDSLEIISPSPNKDQNLVFTPSQCRNLNKKKQDEVEEIEESLLHYDNFETPLKRPNYLVNSTMLCSEENEINATEKCDLSNSLRSDTGSLENLLDNIYGDSWRPFKEKVLPKSARKPCKEKITMRKLPATDRKQQKSVLHENMYLESENGKPKSLLKRLQIKKMSEKENISSLKNTKETEEKDEGYCWLDKENSNKKFPSQQFPKKKLFDADKSENEPDSCSISNEKNNDFNKNSQSSDDSCGNIWGKKFKRKIKKRPINKIFDSMNSSSSNEDEDAFCNETEKKDINKKNVGQSLMLKESTIKKYSVFNEKGSINDILNKYLDKDNNVEKNKTDYDQIKRNKNIKVNSDKEHKELDNLKKKYEEKLSDSSSDSDIVKGLEKLELEKKKQPSTYSFLASLSSNVPDEKCDPSARIFRANFKNTKEDLARKLFRLYNKKIFDNAIPKDTPLQWNARMMCTAGYCYSKKITHKDGKIDMEARIVLSSKVLTTPDRLRDTLIHEMCHAASWLVDGVRDGHGKYWKAWTKKAKNAFPELPTIKTCHNYEINSKYVYKCTDCGYSIKRHRKSLDIERKRCGYCMGKFELFINKVSKKGEQNLIPADTPKKQPTGFALYVQENYSRYNNLKSAEVMKLLSKEFKEMKLKAI